MAIINRSDIRKAVTAILKSTVTAQEILDHLDPDVSGKVSVVQVSSAGTSRINYTRGFADSVMSIGVVVFVLQYASDWTLEQGEDLIDQIEYQIASAIARNQNTELWKAIEYEQSSQVDRVTLSGTPYLMETFLIKVEAK